MDYPQILSSDTTNISPTSLLLTLSVPAELNAFKGHFDNFPLIPGVVQVQWALHFFKIKLVPHMNLEQQRSVQKVSHLKFQHVITPDIQTTLELQFDNDKNVVHFRMYNSDHQFSSGKIWFKTKE